MKAQNRNIKNRVVRVLLIIVAVIVTAIIVAAIGAWNMFGDKITAAKSVKKLDEGLYYMEYRGDYGFDEFLRRGGAASDAKMAEYIIEFLSNGFYKLPQKEVKKDFGCSTLCVSDTSDGKLMGRNFDWKNCNAMIVHTIPKKGYESFSTCNLEFLGFGQNWKPEKFQNQYMALTAIYVPLDGINEKGLCVADLISGDEAETHQRTQKPDVTVVSAIRLLLDNASDVDEAVELLGQYDMNSSIGTSHHLSVSDAEGKSVVIEYVDDEMIVTDTQVVTNHYLSQGKKSGLGNEESHKRYDMLMEMYEQSFGIMDKAKLKGCMENVSYPDITQWSIIYDKEALEFDFYWQTNYDKGYHFVIK